MAGRKTAAYWSDLPLRLKGLIISGVLLLTPLLALLPGYLIQRQATQASHHAAHALSVHAELQLLSARYLDVANQAQGFLLTQRPEYRRAYETRQALLHQSAASLRRLTRGFTDQRLRADAILALLEERVDTLGALLTTSRAEFEQLALSETDDPFLQALEDARQVEEQRLLYLHTQLAALSEREPWALLFSLLLGGGGALLSVVLFDRAVVRRVERARHSAKQLACGHLPFVPISSQDEFGRLEQALSEAASLLRVQTQILRESEARLRNVVASAPIVLYAANRDGVLTFIEGSDLSALGFDRINKVERTITDVFHSSHTIVDSAQRALTGIVNTVEVELAGFVFNARHIPLFDKEGRIDGMIGVLTDITERRRVEDELARQRDFAQRVMNTMGQGLTVIGADGRFEYVNSAFAASSGFRPDDLVGTPIEDILHGEHHRAFTRDSKTEPSTGSSDENTTYEAVLTHANGQLIPVLVTASLLYRSGEFVGWVAVITDLTDRIKVEKERAAQRKFYEGILDRIPVEIAVLDAQARYVFCNPTAIRNDDIRAWIIGKDDFEYCRYRGFDMNVAVKRREKFLQACTTRQPVVWEEQFERADGTRLYHLRNLSPVFDEDELVMVIGYGLEITDRKDYEEQLRQYQAELQRQNMRLEQQQHGLRRLADFRAALVGFINETLSEGLDEGFYRRLLERAVMSIPEAQAGSILLRDDNERFRFVSAIGFNIAALRRVSFTESEIRIFLDAISTRALMELSAFETAAYDSERAEILIQEGRTNEIRGSVSVPVYLENTLVAILNLNNFESAEAFSEDSWDMASAFATQVGVLLKHLKLEQGLARLAELRQVLVEFIGETLNHGLEPSFYQRFLSMAVELVPHAEGGSLLLRDGEGNYRFEAAVNYDLDELRKVVFTRAELARVRALDDKTPYFMRELANGKTLDSGRGAVLGQAGRVDEIAVSLSIPILFERDTIAFLNLDNYQNPDAFDEEAVSMAEAFAAPIGVLLRRLALEQQLLERQREIECTNRDLERANRLKSEFLANMSHELRTPLTAIIGFSELLKEEVFGPLNAKQMTYSRDIYDSGTHLLALINDILDLSKIEAGRMELNLDEHPIPDLLASAVAVIKERAHKAKIRVVTKQPPTLSPIRADVRKLKQVLYNLLSNAVKFTPEGGTVTLRVRETLSAVWFDVIDTGVGIESEHLPALFQNFSQLDTSLARRHEGTGLGLALSKRLVELHGGQITVKSRPGHGSIFSFSIPNHPLRETLAECTTRPKRHVLIMTSDDALAAQLAAWLKAEGLTACRAYDLQAAIDRTCQHQHELLLLDVDPSTLTDRSSLSALACTLDSTLSPIIFLTDSSTPPPEAFASSIRLRRTLDQACFQRAITELLYDADAHLPKRILLVDDDPHVLELLEQYLRRIGYDVSRATTGNEALDACRHDPPDLLILDILLPDISGIDVVDQLRQEGGLGALPIMVLTVQPLDREERRRLSPHVRVILEKGALDQDTLERELRHILVPKRQAVLREETTVTPDLRQGRGNSPEQTE